MNINTTNGISLFIIGFLLSLILPILLSLSNPEPLLFLLRPQQDKILVSPVRFTLLSLNRNGLAAANFAVCWGFVFLLTAFSATRRLRLLFRSISFTVKAASIKIMGRVFLSEVTRGFFAWVTDLRNLPLQLIPPRPVQQGFFEGGLFIENAVRERREIISTSAIFVLFLATRVKTFEEGWFFQNQYSRTNGSYTARWFARCCRGFAIVYYFGGEGFAVDRVRRVRGVFSLDCWFRLVFVRTKLTS